MTEVNNVIALGLCVLGISEFVSEIATFVLRKRHEEWQRMISHRKEKGQ